MLYLSVYIHTDSIWTCSQCFLSSVPSRADDAAGDDVRGVVVVLSHSAGADPEGQHHRAEGQKEEDVRAAGGASKGIGSSR